MVIQNASTTPSKSNQLNFDIYFRESIDMMHKKLVFRQLSRYDLLYTLQQNKGVESTSFFTFNTRYTKKWQTNIYSITL